MKDWQFKSYTTLVRTVSGKIYDLGKFQYPPKHDHGATGTCADCLISNAWPEEIERK